MDVWDCIRTRRSIRKFRDIPVEWDKVGQIISAGRYAPSAGNLQNWQFMVVTDADKRKQIAEASGQQYWMQDAPLFIIVCMKNQIMEQYYGIRGERLYSIQNGAAAAENMMLMAHALGLGSCWVGSFDEEKVKRVCQIPDRARPQVVIAVGYADEQPPIPPRLTLENVTYLNKYGENSGRIADPYGSLGHSAHKVQAAVQEGKRMLDKGTATMEEQSKGILARLRERLKR
ncbi:MAG TPA: nitroreductase family protein [Candidatus Nanoarchaeia archaeon]|nr:nitroreductase family protein [Candidatus Nanoarchaeia archaeon]